MGHLNKCVKTDCDLEPRLARIETMVAQVRAVAFVLGLAAGGLLFSFRWSMRHILLDALNDSEIQAKIAMVKP
jgi:hypothetical protein